MKFLLAILVASLVLVQAPAAKLNGRWRVKFKLSGLEKNVIFEAKENGAGAFKLLDTSVDDKPVAEPVPGVWSQLTNDRVSFSGETELPLGTCCREIGTMMFKGKFTSANARASVADGDNDRVNSGHMLHKKLTKGVGASLECANLLAL